MEIKISIPKNDYVQPTEPRQDVIQKICDILVRMSSKNLRWDNKDVYIGKYNGKDDFFEGCYDYETRENRIRIYGVEMQAAFKIFTQAGYYIHRGVYSNTGRTFYRFSKKPFLKEEYDLVTEFTEFID